MNIEVLQDCWRRAAPGDVYMPRQERPSMIWHEGDPVEALLEQPEHQDLYFTPLSFDGARKNENVLGPIRVLYADLDESDPRELDISPSVAWATSPGSYQALWWLSKGVSIRDFMALNRQLTYYTHADKGGWHPSKAIRVPGSVNWKRGGVKGELLWHRQSRFDPSWLFRRLEAGEGTLPTPIPPRIPAIVSKADLPLNELPISLKWSLSKPWDDRSLAIWKTSKEFKRWGYPSELAFQILWHADFNKYRVENRPQRLWADVTRAYGA